MLFFYHSPLVLSLIIGSVILMLGLTWVICKRKNVLLYLLVSWCILFGMLATGMYCLDYVAEIAKQGLQNNLSGLAKSFAVALKNNSHADITFDTPDTDPLYWKLINTMSEWQKHISIAASIYTLRKNDAGEIIFICCPPADLNRDQIFHGENEELVPKGTVYEYEEGDIPEILDAFWGKSSFNNTPTLDDWGLWTTAAEPIFDDSGDHIDAVLGVDFWGEDWNENIQNAIFWPKMFLLSAIIIFFVVQIFVIRQQFITDRLTEYTLNLEHVTEELIEAKKQSDSAVQAKSYFIANISHEIRTPMNAILGCANLLANSNHIGQVRPDQNQLFDIIQKSGKNLIAIIDDVLTFSNIDMNRIVFEKVPVELKQMVRDVLSMVGSLLEEKPHLKLQTEFSDAVPEFITGDPARLRQVLLCLVKNAIKFTKEGTVTIRCSVVEPSRSSLPPEETIVSSRMIPTLHPQIAQAKGLRGTIRTIGQEDTQSVISPFQVREMSESSQMLTLRIDVSDTGIGISEDQFSLLFKPFSQVDNSSTRKYGGTGLGLSLAKGLVQLMGGSIEVESLGQGSTFSILLPVKE